MKELESREPGACHCGRKVIDREGSEALENI